jgi:DnaJ-like protein
VSVTARIAEARIVEAIERGDLDDLPGSGRPLELEDLSRVPADLRPAYKVLRNAGVLPPELEVRRQIQSLGRLIDETAGEDERERLRREWRRRELHYSILVERRTGRLALGLPARVR